ncbi:hypothetical protein PN836_018670 [Ningiella sp. W23]|uniref:hypothetical protein n=1 Tax=Ningiella sp. W23 TaxID=3023715 RepID=UPI003756B42A
MKVILVTILLLLGGCNAMTTNHWKAPTEKDPHANIVAQEDMDLMWVNDLPVNGWGYWTFENFILPAGKSEVVMRARRGNDHFALASFHVDLTEGEKYYFVNEVVGINYRISLLDSNKQVIQVAVAPQQQFNESFTLPVVAIPRTN